MAPLKRSKSGTSQADEVQIQHFIHHHLLHKIYMASEFNCDGCNTGGYGVRDRCSACDFDVHEQCATSPHRISSHHHPHHHLILINRPGDSRLCDVCKGATKGLSYTCECHTCQFNVHTLCISNNQHVLINQMPTVLFGGDNSQPYHQRHGLQPGGYHGVNNINQTHMINQQQGIPMMGFGGYQGVRSNNQPQMINPQQQGIAMTNQPQMINPQQQGMAMTNQPQMINPQQQGIGFGCYHNSQPVMVNHHQQQQQVIPATAFNSNYQLVTNHHQQLQQQGMGMGGVGGYNVVNHSQSGMVNHPPPQQQSSGYTKVGKLAANILSTSLIGVPIFNPRN